MRTRIWRAAAIASAVLAGVVATSASAAPAAPTGSCGRTFDVTTPTTLKCTLVMSATSSHYVAAEQVRKGRAKAGLVVLSAKTSVDKAPLACADVEAGLTATGICPLEQWGRTATSGADGKPFPAGTTLTCTARVLGRGSFTCTSYSGGTPPKSGA